MTPFNVLVSRACPLAIENIDTDQLLPARFLSRSRKMGYAGLLLHDLRNDAAGNPVPDFPLNNRASAGAAILVTRRNFGAGSSREAAVYALVDAGIRCVLAPSFGDIFATNAVNNGVLPAIVDEQDIERLLSLLMRTPETSVTIDLTTSHVRVELSSMNFDIDRSSRERLLNGWDEFDLTQRHREAIDSFRADDRARRDWVHMKELRRRETG